MEWIIGGMCVVIVGQTLAIVCMSVVLVGAARKLFELTEKFSEQAISVSDHAMEWHRADLEVKKPASPRAPFAPLNHVETLEKVAQFVRPGIDEEPQV